MSVEQFVHGKKDVLVATDIASKGLDFPNIQHVINYDMPDDIENYGKPLLHLHVYFCAIVHFVHICVAFSFAFLLISALWNKGGHNKVLFHFTQH